MMYDLMGWKSRLGSHLQLFNAFSSWVTSMMGGEEGSCKHLLIYYDKDRKAHAPVTYGCLLPCHISNSLERGGNVALP